MKKSFFYFAITLAVFLLSACVSNKSRGYPCAEISNGKITAVVATETGRNDNYYRATRFDWSGQIYQLECGGHSYYGEFFLNYDPYFHDTVCGPAEEFEQIGYNDVKINEGFVKIGVGLLKKTDDTPYNIRRLYKIIDNGKWTTEVGKNFVSYKQVLNSNVASYIYTKKIELVENSATMLIKHSIKNTGKNKISTNTYCHNFFMLDEQSSGKAISIKLPFTPTDGDFLPQIKGYKIVRDASILKDGYLRLTRTLVEPERILYRDISGANKVENNDFRLENSDTGAAVRIRGNRPLSKLTLWSNARTHCIEPYIDIDIAPNEEFSWEPRYDFYSTK